MDAYIAEIVFRNASSCGVVVEVASTAPVFGTLRTNEPDFFQALGSSPEVPAQLRIPGCRPIEIVIGDRAHGPSGGWAEFLEATETPISSPGHADD